MPRTLFILLAIAISPLNVLAESAFWPGADLDDSIPSLESVIGHRHGDEISTPAEIDQYIKALAKAAPNRTRLVEYARTWEGRPLSYLVISAEQNLARITDIQEGVNQLAAADKIDGDTAAQLVDSLPAIVWLSYGVHGNEISSSDAALVLAHHLLADQSGQFADIMENAITIIDPAQNPDGRARFVQHYQQHRGLVPAPSPIAAERREAWPGGRANHYLFDMNRDWFALTQPETRGRVASLLSWYPLIHVDVHEMGTDSTYYFPPPARPFNPHVSDAQKVGLDRLGKGMADQFDRFGFDYFTREVFDALYPGYGDSWPAFHGALGMTFEMASARGLAGERSDGSIVTYRDGVQRHFVATVGTLLTAVRDRRELLNDFYEFRLAASKDDRVYGFSSEANDPALVRRLGEKLMLQGIRVEVAKDTARVCGENLAEGSLVVRAGQPAGRLVRTLLDAESPVAEAFVAEQERRRAKGLPVELYDILGWSMPAAYGIETLACKGSPSRNLVALGDMSEPVTFAEAGLAYLIAWNSRASATFLSAALRQGLAVHTSTLPFTQAGREFPAGTLIVKVRENGANLYASVSEIAAETGADVIPTESSWSEAGSNFGSSNVKRVLPPKIALAWDEPTRSLSTGATRYIIERELGYPVTPVRTSDLDRPELADFDVLILPDGSYGDNPDSEALSLWVKNGGTLIGFSRAVRFLIENGMLPTARELLASEATESDDDKDEETESGALIDGTIIASDTEYRDTLIPESPVPDSIPGVIMRGVVDPDHWLGAGVRSPANFMIQGSDVYRPLALDEGTNVIRFAEADNLVASGYLWEENRAQWQYKPAVMATRSGRGQVIGFVADPTFRAMFSGLDVLIANAIFRGPAYVD